LRFCLCNRTFVAVEDRQGDAGHRQLDLVQAGVEQVAGTKVNIRILPSDLELQRSLTCLVFRQRAQHVSAVQYGLSVHFARRHLQLDLRERVNIQIDIRKRANRQPDRGRDQRFGIVDAFARVGQIQRVPGELDPRCVRFRGRCCTERKSLRQNIHDLLLRGELLLPQ
jgi:hypothetical protein